MMGFAEALNPSCALASGFRICPTGNTANQCPAPSLKIFSFPSEANQLFICRRLVPLEGRLAIVTDAGRDAVDAGDVKRRMTWLADGEAVWS
jgi:hypothetical protein